MKFSKGDVVTVIETGEQVTVVRYGYDSLLGYLIQVEEEGRIYQEEMLSGD